MAEKIKIGGELEPKTVEGILGDASTIIDRTNYDTPKRQDDINAEKVNVSDIKDAASASAVDWEDEDKPVSARTAKVIKEYVENKLPDDVLLDDAPTANSNNAVKSGGTKEAIDNVAFATNEKVNTVGIDSEPTAGSNNLVKSGGVQNELALGAVYDVSAKNSTAGPNNDGKWESLSVLLTDANLNTLIPASVRKGGMSIKFVQSSDNKYVQYFLTKDEWSASEGDWEKTNIEDDIFTNKMLINMSTIGKQSKWVNENGVSSESANYFLTEYIKVNEGDRFLYGWVYNAIGCPIAFYTAKEESTFVSENSIKTNTASRVIQKGEYVSPANGYIRLCYRKDTNNYIDGGAYIYGIAPDVPHLIDVVKAGCDLYIYFEGVEAQKFVTEKHSSTIYFSFTNTMVLRSFHNIAYASAVTISSLANAIGKSLVTSPDGVANCIALTNEIIIFDTNDGVYKIVTGINQTHFQVLIVGTYEGNTIMHPSMLSIKVLRENTPKIASIENNVASIEDNIVLEKSRNRYFDWKTDAINGKSIDWTSGKEVSYTGRSYVIVRILDNTSTIKVYGSPTIHAIHFYSGYPDVVNASNLVGVRSNFNVIPQNSKYFTVSYNTNSCEYLLVWQNGQSTILDRNEDILDSIKATCTYNTGLSGSIKKSLCLLVSGDIHADSRRMASIIDYLNKSTDIDAGIMLGDIVQQNWFSSVDFYNNTISKTEKPFLTVIGNHDVGDEYAKEDGYPDISALYDKFIAPNIQYAELSGSEFVSGNTYYYKDFSTYKTRIIVLNQYEYTDELNAAGTDWLFPRGVKTMFSQEQIDWFISTLNSTPSDYGVIIALHSCPSNSGWISDTDSPFMSKLNPDGNMAQSFIQGNIIEDIVDAWISGGVLSHTYNLTVVSQDIPNLSVSADFSSRGTGVFVCYIGGHFHRSCVNHYGENQQLRYNVDCASMQNDIVYLSDTPRAEGTKSEDCFVLLSVNYDLGTVNLIRIGAHRTQYMENRFAIGLPFYF